MQVIEPDPQLGEALANFPSNRLRPLIIAGAVIAPVALLLGLTTAQVEAWWGPLVTVIVVALVGLIAGWYVLHGWNREIILYERGFSYREGSTVVYFNYDEVASIRSRAERLAYFGGLIHRNRYRYDVSTWAGDRFTITHQYRHVDQLGTQLTEAINRVLAPEIAQRLADGKLVAFGDTLRIGGDGLHDGGRTLAWRDFNGYRIGGRKLTILAAGDIEWLALPLGEIDNVLLLVALLKGQIATREGQRPASRDGDPG